MAADPARVQSAEAPNRGVKRRFEHGRPPAATGLPALSPQRSSPCPSFIDVPPAILSDRVMNADACRSSLGDRTFAILRKAMLNQQEIFLEQLWELHKLARTQGRKAALLAAEARLPVPTDPQSLSMNPQRQVQLQQKTMQAILNLQCIPASLRRPAVSAGPDAFKATPVPGSNEPSTGTNAAGAEAHANPAIPHTHVSQPTAADLSKSAFPGHLMMCPVGFNMQYGPQGISCPPQAGFSIPTDPSAVSLHWPGGPQFAGSAFPGFHAGAVPGFSNIASVGAPFLQGLSMPSVPLAQCVPAFTSAQSSTPESANTQSPATAQPPDANARQADVSSLLGMVMPGISAQPDLHAQWFAKNMGGASKQQDMSAAFLGIQNAMDTASPPPVCDHVYSAEPTRSNPSNSLWSGNTLVMPPSISPAQGPLEGLNEKAGSGSVPVPSNQAPAVVNGFVDVQNRVGDASGAPVPAQRNEAGGLPNEKAHVQGNTQRVTATGQTCRTDESAASILMSLKGSN